MSMNQKTPEPTMGAEPPVCGNVQVSLCDRIITTDREAIFSLPDYQPEIEAAFAHRRVGAPPARYAGGNGMDLAGTVDYFVLYMGNDDQVYCAAVRRVSDAGAL